MSVGPEAYREAAKRYASGVTLVTVARPDGSPHGMTATAFAAVSLDPPLVLVCLEKHSRTREIALGSGTFAINLLRADQEAVAKAFATSGEKSFDGIPYSKSAQGIPLLDEAIVTMLCRTVEVAPGGDHDIFIAEVEGCEARDGEPLLYFDRSYRSLD